MIKLNFPKTGMGIDEGTIIRWTKSEGETVTAGELLVEVETAKATVEIEAPANGVLTSILVREGASVEVNTVLGEIDEAHD